MSHAAAPHAASAPRLADRAGAPPPHATGGRALLGLAGWAALCLAAAAGGGIASASAGPFYLGLDRPGWAPPAWLFGPVWTVLYALMAIAAWLVWRARGFGGARGALLLFVAQLVPNFLWTWTFFVARRASWATVDIAVLLALIVATIVAFARVRPARAGRTAAALLVPYLAWVSFATALTLALWRRNPAVLG